MILHRGMRNQSVAELQKRLREYGFSPGMVDGYFGPKTEGAVRSLQSSGSDTPTGAVTSKQAIGIGLNTPQVGLNTTDYTDDDDTRFAGLPGEPEVWLDKDTGKAYIVYTIPGTDPPIPLMFEVSSDADLESFFGDDDVAYDRKLTSDEILSVGGIKFGTTDNIPATEGDPWAGFLDRIDRAMEVQPWLEDPEVLAIYAGAWLEGRDVEEWELQTTDWWQGLTADQRAWVALQAGDPSQADRQLEDNYLQVFQQFQALGVAEPNADMIEYMANQWTYGNWSQDYLQEQIFNVTGIAGAGGAELDEGLADWLTDNEVSLESGVLMENRVRDMFRRWLGPSFAPSQDQLLTWADTLRRGGEGAMDQLTNYLRNQRLAIFQDRDPSLTYEDIAAPWRSFAQGIWGQQVDERDPMFMEILRANDTTTAGQILRKEGLSRGIKPVVEDAMTKLKNATGGQVQNPI